MSGDRVEAYPTDEQVRIAVAQITGLVQRYAQRHEAARDRTLRAIGEAARGLTDDQLKQALLHVTAHYMIGGRECWYREEALKLLAATRDDLDTAEQIAAMRLAQRRLHIGDEAVL